MSLLKEKYTSELAPKIQEDLGIKKPNASAKA